MRTIFSLSGHYISDGAPGGRGELTGEIDVKPNGVFEGEIKDLGSRVPDQFLRGHLIKQSGQNRLCFLKFPQSENFTNLAYDLKGPRSFSWEHKYAGNWGALPFKVEYNREFKIYLASVDMSVCNISDFAEINLSVK